LLYYVCILIIFVIGEFYFVIHVCLTIYRLGFATYLQPVTTTLHYANLKQDFILCEWSKYDEFLILFVKASFTWLYGIC
jgi:hypothetical protein